MQRLAMRPGRIRTGFAFLVVGAAIAYLPSHAHAQLTSTGVRAVPTYESVGLYWSSPGAGSAGCDLQYRAQGETSWRQALAMWFDASRNECRGSIVYLNAGTTYEVQMGVNGAYTRGTTFTTWSNSKPVARTYSVSSGSATLNVSEGGSEGGYVVYDGGGSAVLDAQNSAPYNVTINASYVIVRGMTLKGATTHGVLISPNVHDVIIEDNDISGWGRTRDGTWGADMDSGIRAICQSEELTRVTIQRNRIHDPRYPTNSWALGHPAGAQGVTFSYCGGQNVYRWNELDGGANHFNDCMGGEDNYSTTGWPNKDSDVYGNKCQNSWDDGLEIEGGNMNVRVWGNYVNKTGTGISSTITSVGPLYIFRNVWNRNQFIAGAACDSDQRQPMFKSGSSSDFGNGRRYLLHNTMLQAQQSGCSNGLGGAAGVGGTGDSQLVHNTVSMNNIYHVYKSNGAFYQLGSDNTFQNDMTNAASSPEVNNIVATPQYASGSGWQSEDGGLYQLAAGTPGYDQGARIANFNDHFNGSAPDVGAAEAGDAAMKFGLAASGSTAPTPSGSGTTTPVTTPTPTPTPTPSPTPGSGSVGPTATMDSSSYTVAAGQGVTFTARISGASGTPSGSVSFRDNGAAISGCASLPLSGGAALCTTNALAGGSHAITGVYSGDATYSTAQAGPITQTVTGTLSASTPTPAPTPSPTPGTGTGSTSSSATMDSSAYTIGAGQGVTFTARIMGNAGTPTGVVSFRDNGVNIPGCASVALSSGAASCTTSALAGGTHSITGIYPGDATYSAAQAGPIQQTVSGSTPAPVTQPTTSASYNVQGLWWQPSESGWGVNLSQQGELLFATWFTYDDRGNGQWLVMSQGAKTAENTYTGVLYRTSGPSYATATFDPSQVTRAVVGAATFSFTDGNNGTFTATVNGSTISKPITRQVFQSIVPTCSEGASAGSLPNFQDLWWRAAGTESGWGLNITHQSDVLFMTWFTYDTDGTGLWLVAPSVVKTGNNTYAGTLYRTWGPAFDAASFDPASVQRVPVGQVTFSFSDASNGTFSYTVNGVAGQKPITRQVFATPSTMCH